MGYLTKDTSASNYLRNSLLAIYLMDCIAQALHTHTLTTHYLIDCIARALHTHTAHGAPTNYARFLVRLLSTNVTISSSQFACIPDSAAMRRMRQSTRSI